ncbi:lipopolysaccharide assembly protein LapB [Aurantimonas sp. HBX-1]|uniref:tetratricopeptide repeat protein n=1 Tax=Aurantimonas sp. HBX-1 TaxID=2906072 RepID=UPI001F1A35F5|nr:tetratricopeptide repeat protein [Aurantimonas sp. HBX-1]UIJ74130.1 tetratricopeptide repeat protein [Aurantimonas sp. HBX-1]
MRCKEATIIFIQKIQPVVAVVASIWLLTSVACAQSAEELLTGARNAADQEDHERAVDLFRQAIDEAPERRPEWLRELADQIVYAGRPADAVSLYRELLDTAGIQDEQRATIRRNLAFALLWSGQSEAAVEALSEIVSERPEDEEARRALAEAKVAVLESGAEDEPESTADLLEEEDAASVAQPPNEIPAEEPPAAPSRAETAIADARAAAGRGDNAEAARLFAEALRLDESVDPRIAIELADQVTYSGDPARGAEIYRQSLNRLQMEPVERVEVERKLAFALLWSGQFSEAVRNWQVILGRDERDEEARAALTDAWVGAARQAAGDARNAEGARAFERAFSVDPARRRELLREYADQVLYSGRPAASIPLYREHLAQPRLDPDERRRGLLGLARGLAWSGDHERSLPAYGELLETWPRDVDARIGRGQSLNASRNHQAAFADFQIALSVEPQNAEAIRGAAQAETSMGRHLSAIERLRPLIEGEAHDPRTLMIAANAQRHLGRTDLAEALAVEALQAGADDAGAQALLETLRFERRPLSYLDAQYVARSDDLTIATATASHEIFVNQGLTSFGPQLKYATYDGGDFPSVDVGSLGFFFRHRFDERLEARTSLFLNHEMKEGDGDVSFTHDSVVSLLLNDSWRTEVLASRRYADENPRVFVNDILANDYGGAVHFTPGRDWRGSVRGLYSTYSDDNERFWAQADGAYNLHETQNIWLGVRATAFDFERSVDNNYWNPGAYQSLHATLHAYGSPAPHWWVDVQGALGYAWSEEDGDGITWSAETRISRDLGEAAALEFRGLFQYSDARQSEATEIYATEQEPFWRSSLGLRLRVRW